MTSIPGVLLLVGCLPAPGDTGAAPFISTVF